MPERVKLIWDFHGPNAEPTAQHHAKHLTEYIEVEGLKNSFTGHEKMTPSHFTAFMVVEKSLMNTLRETLKPTRGQYYND